MAVERTIRVSEFVDNFYEEVAVRLGNHKTEEAMAAALESYALHLFEEMLAEGTIASHKPELKLYKIED